MSENINIIDDLIAEGRRMAENETEADILAEMRESGEVARFYADRLDAARKREVDALKQRLAELDAKRAVQPIGMREGGGRRRGDRERHPEAPGKGGGEMNDRNQRMRDALKTIRKRLVAAYESEANFMRYSPNKPLVDLIDAALAAPPRNCDALTADERTHKFIEKWEKAHGESIDGKTIIYLSSFSRWTQLPYESEVGK